MTLNQAGNAIGVLEGWMVGRTVTAASVDQLGDWSVQLGWTATGPQYIVWNPNSEQTWTAPTGFVVDRIRTLTGGTSMTARSKVTVGPIPQLVVLKRNN